MSRNRALLLGGGLVVVAAILGGIAYPHMPASVPIHWDAAGHANGYGSRFWAVAAMPLLMLGMLALMIVLPAISPKGFRFDDSLGAFDLIVFVIVLLSFGLNVVTLRAALGAPAPGINVVLPGIGVLFVVIGNYMGKFRKNFFLGIRTPWTLASDEVWLRTHRFGSWIFILGGLALGATGLLTQSPIPVVIITGLIVLIPTVYSYIAYARIEGFASHDT